MRDHIIAEIRRLAAANGGKAPGVQAFKSQTGIGESKWRGVYWTKWGDALEEAGLSANEWTQRHDTFQLTEQFARITLELGHVPTWAELALLRREDDVAVPSPKNVSTHFRGKEGVIEALRDLSYRHCRRRRSCSIRSKPTIPPVLRPIGTGGSPSGARMASGSSLR